MTAVEEIQAAIAKLTEMRDQPPVVATFRNVDQSSAAWFARAEVKLAMFHRTIDAQLVILAAALEFARRYEDSTAASISASSPSMQLAIAINGGAS